MCLRWRLRALKVTGDPNVPSGKISFSLDLTQHVNIAEAVQQDLRPLLYASSSGVNRVEHIHVAVTRVACWYRGRGQINRIPGDWDPEWVSCSLLVYERPRELSGAVAVLLWEDLDDSFRLSKELFPMIQSNANRRDELSCEQLI